MDTERETRVFGQYANINSYNSSTEFNLDASRTVSGAAAVLAQVLPTNGKQTPSHAYPDTFLQYQTADENSKPSIGDWQANVKEEYSQVNVEPIPVNGPPRRRRDTSSYTDLSPTSSEAYRFGNSDEKKTMATSSSSLSSEQLLTPATTMISDEDVAMQLIRLGSAQTTVSYYDGYHYYNQRQSQQYYGQQPQSYQSQYGYQPFLQFPLDTAEKEEYYNGSNSELHTTPPSNKRFKSFDEMLSSSDGTYALPSEKSHTHISEGAYSLQQKYYNDNFMNIDDSSSNNVQRARCTRCKKAKKGCDRKRPCSRCVASGLGPEDCISEGEADLRMGVNGLGSSLGRQRKRKPSINKGRPRKSL